MNRENDLWELEKYFWLLGAEFYERTLAPAALMVLPQPVGILDRPSVIRSIDSGARWQTVSLSQQHCAFPTTDMAILAYIAQAERSEPGAGYVAQCSSVYSRNNRMNWQLVLHQQTPVN